MLKARMIEKMIAFYEGDLHNINHFMKVYAYASVIGRLERLEAPVQDTLEMTAIVHDIACPLCVKRYGNASGAHQERESEALLRPFLKEFNLSDDQEDRIVFLVTHHHTCEGVDGPDYRILLEADYLVNADEGHASREEILETRMRVFETAGGTRLLDAMFLSRQ